MAAQDDLLQQILGQGLTSKWSGEGLGGAEANAKEMARILDSIGITDIKQFGKVPTYEKAEIGGYKYNGHQLRITPPNEEGQGGGQYYYQEPTGETNYNWETGENIPVMRTIMVPKDAKVEPIYGTQVSSGARDESGNDITYFSPVKESDLVPKDGKLLVKTGENFGNKETGQAVPITYSERQRGDFFGGTFAGSGNTGYGVQFGPDGTPIFYTQGASSNDLANLMADLGPVGQIGLALATGGLSIPQQIAAQMAVQVLSGKDIGDAIKGAAVSLAVAQIPGTDFMKEVGVSIKDLGLDPAIANTINNAAQNAAMSATRAALTGQDIFDSALKGAAAGGVNGAVGEIVKGIPDFDKLTPTQQKMAANAVTGVISGKPMDQILINSAIAAANAEIHGSKTTAGPVNTTGVDKTTVGNFDDTEITRLEKLGYTKDQIKEYFKGLDNLTEIFDEPPTTLPVDDTTKPADADADVKALEKSGLPTATDDNVVVTAPRGPDGYTDAERESKRLQDLIAVGGDGVDTLTITGPRPPAPQPDEHVFDPTYGGIFKPTAPDPNELVITDKKLPAYLPTDDDFPRTPQPSTPTLPTATTPPAAQPPASSTPSINIDPVKALETLYNPFAPSPASKSTPSQTDTGPIQLMTDVFGTNIATAQKAGARGYGFSAGGDIDELLRLLRS